MVLIMGIRTQRTVSGGQWPLFTAAFFARRLSWSVLVAHFQVPNQVGICIYEKLGHISPKAEEEAGYVGFLNSVSGK